MQKVSPRQGGICLTLCLLLLGYQLSLAQLRTTRHAVISSHPLATAAGIEILNKGGNVFDAAIAVEFALAVVWPQAGNIGGGGFALYHKADGTLAVLDYRETAPAAAHARMYLDPGGKPSGRYNRHGGWVAGVPGTVQGMAALYAREGSLPWDELLAPAIRLAKGGFQLRLLEAQYLNAVADSLRKYSRNTEGYTRGDGRPWLVGDTLRLTTLGNTLQQIAEQGASGFYEGPVAVAITEEAAAQGGLITSKDLADYKPVWRKPLEAEFNGFQLVTMPPPSSGGIALVQVLGMLSGHDLHALGHNSPAYIHLVAEAMRRHFADRAQYLGDPDFISIPLDTLLSQAYLKRRMASFRPDKATPSAELGAGAIMGYESEQTTHYSVMDTAGNVVSATTTLNSGFGCYTVVQGAGFILNNQMDDFAIAPNTPNTYGLVGSNANAIAPKKRPLSSMTPTLILRGGRVVASLGTPGGSTIPTSVLQGLLNLLVFDMSAYEAANASRFHHQWLPDVLYLEQNRFSDTKEATLRALGHSIRYRSIGGSLHILRVTKDGHLETGPDARIGDPQEGLDDGQ